MTGLDLWQEKNGVRNDDTLGVARTRGMCHYKFSCAVGESGNAQNLFYVEKFHLICWKRIEVNRMMVCS